jgi:hypothetical protein
MELKKEHIGKKVYVLFKEDIKNMLNDTTALYVTSKLPREDFMIMDIDEETQSFLIEVDNTHYATIYKDNVFETKQDYINDIMDKLFYIISSYEALYQKLLQEKADDVKIAKDIVKQTIDEYALLREKLIRLYFMCDL